MPWGLNHGGPRKVAPSNFLIPMTNTNPKLISGAAGAHIWSQDNFFLWEMQIFRVLVKSLQPATPHFQLYFLSEHNWPVLRLFVVVNDFRYFSCLGFILKCVEFAVLRNLSLVEIWLRYKSCQLGHKLQKLFFVICI